MVVRYWEARGAPEVVAMKCLWLLVLPIPLLAALPACSADDEKTDLVEPVRKAIERGVKYLRSQQHDGDWEHQGMPGKPGAVTSLALLALLNSGMAPDDPIIQNGLKSLRKVEPEWTYVVGLQTMVFALARQPVDRERIQRNVDWLIKARLQNNGKLVGWGYKAGLAPADNSNTQYALLGLHEGHVAGAAIGEDIWKSILDYYRDTPRADGGWGYRAGMASSPTMTTAGVCGLLIASTDMRSKRKECPPEKCGIYEEDRSITKGLDYIGRTLLPNDKIENHPHLYYFLYGLERAGRLSGRRFFGGHDWYREGCRYLVKAQENEGSWMGGRELGGTDQALRLIDTSFALLFLSKGRTPVLITKLAFGPPDQEDWNNDRNDARNLVDYCSREIFKQTPLAWQVFDVRGGADLTRKNIQDFTEELLESPIVYMNGHRAPRLEGGVKDMLREYVNNGGFILGEACCGNPSFDRGFHELMNELFPDNKLEPIPADHPVWTASGKFVSRPSDFELEGVRLGCKWVVIYSKGIRRNRPEALCCRWEVNDFEGADGKKAFQLGANIVAYATGLEPPKPRGHIVEVPRDASDKKVARGSLAVAQIQHEGDWHPAPKAMRNLMIEMAKEGIDVTLKTQEITLDDKDLIDYKFFYMHGRKDFRFGGPDLEVMRFNLKEGGAILFADACCGSKTFDKSFRKFVADLFPDKKMEVIPLSDELFAKDLNGTAITQVRCRREAPDGGGPERAYRLVDPYLEGIKIDGRWVVIYSKYDIGCALENNKSSDCLGHDHDSAVRLAKAVVFYALKR
jgi:hypothetical protein